MSDTGIADIRDFDMSTVTRQMAPICTGDFLNEDPDSFDGGQEEVSFIRKSIVLPEWMEEEIEQLSCRYDDDNIKYSTLLAIGLRHAKESELFS